MFVSIELIVDMSKQLWAELNAIGYAEWNP